MTKKIKPINWNQGFDCFSCRHNHPHAHTIEEVRYFKNQAKGISTGYVVGISDPVSPKRKETNEN